MMKLYIVLLFCIGCISGLEKGSYIGCYKYKENQDVITNIPNTEDCINNCEKQNFKFAVLSNSNTTCFCSNFLGELGNSYPSEKCTENSVYSSRDTIPGPPQNFHIVSVTDEGIQIAWNKPHNFVDIISYEINASVLHTFSHYPIQNTTWIYSNNTFQTALTLQSASKYNISIAARSNEGLGTPASKIVGTSVGTPDNIPLPPDIISRNGSRMTIKILPVINNNGPISYYQVIVMNKGAKQIFQAEYLKNFQDSLEDDLNYYITAELTPEDARNNFVVGDGKYYGNYFNAPLFPNEDYNLLVGIVSNFNGETKIAYSNSGKTYQGIHVFDVEHDDGPAGSSLITVFLIIGIVILSILLIVGIVGFIFLRKKIMLKHRHNRLTEQELTLQGPMINVENSAYLPEGEQMPINYYKSLKERVKILNLKDELSVDAHSIIGKGKFGAVCNAILREENGFVPVAAYCIPDKSLTPENKKLMLKDFDMLIKAGKHDNLIELIGTSESSHMLYVILRLLPTDLKQFLISNRVLLSNKFFKISESQVLGIITQITHGLYELEKCGVYHKQLCAKNIMLTEDLIPKITGFGLADYVTEKELDYTRWSAVEILKGQSFNSRSPIWSFGTLLWEICALGATPYSDISNISEVIDKITRGVRLPQLKYFNDDVYQIMLNCWQVDMGERPDCNALCRVIENLQEDTIIPFISFNLHQSFEYEPYKPELEFKSYL